MGNDNPIRNNKLLREAFQAGRRAALNEQMGGGASMQRMPMNPQGAPGGNRMGMGMSNMGKNAAALAGKIPPGPGTYPGGIYDPQDGTRPQEVVPECPFPMPKGSSYKWNPRTGQWEVMGPNGYPLFYFAYPPGKWMPTMAGGSVSGG